MEHICFIAPFTSSWLILGKLGPRYKQLTRHESHPMAAEFWSNSEPPTSRLAGRPGSGLGPVRVGSSCDSTLLIQVSIPVEISGVKSGMTRSMSSSLEGVLSLDHVWQLRQLRRRPARWATRTGARRDADHYFVTAAEATSPSHGYLKLQS
jgi:hypothetical protein